MVKRNSIVNAVAIAGAAAFASGAMADGGPRGSLKDRAPVAAAYNWTGFYAGINAGYAWGESNVSNSFQAQPGDTWVGGGPVGTPGRLSAAGSGKLSDDGFTGGAQIGYNWQSGALVLGVEADINYIDVNVSRSVRAPYVIGGATGVDINDQVSASYLATVRARLGYAAGQALFYVTGGLAVTDLKHSHSVNEFGFGAIPACAPTSGNWCDGGGSKSDVKTGYTVGGGVEFALNRNWTLKGEYLYADFGKISSATSMFSNGAPPLAPIANSAIGHSADLVLHSARVGLNYKF